MVKASEQSCVVEAAYTHIASRRCWAQRPKLHVDTTAHPKFCKARVVPLALQKKLEAVLNKLEAQGVIESQIFGLDTSIVPITKQDGTIRICGDYKLAVN